MYYGLGFVFSEWMEILSSESIVPRSEEELERSGDVKRQELVDENLILGFIGDENSVPADCSKLLLNILKSTREKWLSFFGI